MLGFFLEGGGAGRALSRLVWFMSFVVLLFYNYDRALPHARTHTHTHTHTHGCVHSHDWVKGGLHEERSPRIRINVSDLNDGNLG